MESTDERGHNVTMSEDLWGPTVNREVYTLGLEDLVCDIHWHAHLRPLKIMRCSREGDVLECLEFVVATTITFDRGWPETL